MIINATTYNYMCYTNTTYRTAWDWVNEYSLLKHHYDITMLVPHMPDIRIFSGRLRYDNKCKI